MTNLIQKSGVSFVLVHLSTMQASSPRSGLTRHFISSAHLHFVQRQRCMFRDIFLSNSISSRSVIDVIFSMIDDAEPLFDAITDPNSVAVGRGCTINEEE